MVLDTSMMCTYRIKTHKATHMDACRTDRQAECLPVTGDDEAAMNAANGSRALQVHCCIRYQDCVMQSCSICY
jgi:hypothetical protein